MNDCLDFNRESYFIPSCTVIETQWPCHFYSGEGPPLYLQFKVVHNAANPDEVLTEETIKVDNQDLVAAVNETLMPAKSYGYIDSSTGYSKVLVSKLVLTENFRLFLWYV